MTLRAEPQDEALLPCYLFIIYVRMDINGVITRISLD
jgi:hypothetical protein